MAKKMCICKVCGKQFDRNSEQAVVAGARRYAHLACMPNGELVPMESTVSVDPDLRILNEYIKNLYGDKANWPLIKKQIKKFHTENGYSYSGILKSLQWFYEVKHNSPDKSNGGIGIVEFCFQDAYNYYYQLYLAEQNAKQVNIEGLINNVKEIIIKRPQQRKKKRLFDLDWEVEDEE